jgi:uncharacterized protein involved in outer membrane biogenesis
VATTPRWTEIKGRARRLAERGGKQLRRTRERLGRMVHEPPRRPPVRAEVGPDGAAVAHAGPDPKTLKIAGIVVAVLALLIVVLIAVWDWNWFRGPIEKYASARTGRVVQIQGDLGVKLLTWTPEVTVDRLRVGPPKWAGKEDTAVIDHARMRVKLMPLFVRRVEVPLVQLDRPRFVFVRDKQGRASWRFGNDQSDKPTRLPPIQRFIINDGKLEFTDQKRGLRLTGTVQSQERLTGKGEGAFSLIGDGSLNSNPFKLTITGGPLINVRRDAPYRFNADIRMGATHVTADGAITKPFDFGQYQARLRVSGPDMADLYYLTGLTFPNTPAYQASGNFSRDDDVYRYSRFSGRVGRSDLAGNIKVSKPKDRRLLEADLRSRSLNVADLAAVTGGGSSQGRPTGRLLPDARLDSSRLKAMDAHVRYRADSVQANRFRVSAVRLGVRLNNALLTVDPLSFSFARGRLDGRVRMDGRKSVPVTDVDLKLTGYALESLLPARFAGAVSGPVEGYARLHGSGMSVHETAARASGKVRMVVPHGEVRQAFAELMGINVGRGLYLLLKKDPRRTNIRCAVADFDVAGGVARPRRLVIDTGVVTSRGEGSINLANETLNLRFKGDSKKPRLLRLWAPITVQGRLTKPKVGVEAGPAVAQAGIGAALGALVSPLAAVLPFIDPGGKDVNCQALLAGR